MSQFSNEVKVIPKPAKVLAGLIIVGVPLLALCYFVLNSRNVSGMFAIPEIVAMIAAMFFGVYVLLLGYIYGDAKRRGMRPVLWLLLGLFIPNAIGVILYFILRQPIQTHCPTCGASNPPGFAFCASCGGVLRQSCPSCKNGVEANWSHCPRCGAQLNPITPQTP